MMLGGPIRILLRTLIKSYSVLAITKIFLPVDITADFALADNPSNLRYKSIGFRNDSLRKVFKGTNFKSTDMILSCNSYKAPENLLQLHIAKYRKRVATQQRNAQCAY